MLEMNQLPMDVFRKLPDRAAMHHLVSPLQICLCNTVAHAGLTCDPGFCSKKLTESIDWVQEGEQNAAKMGGVGKAIYRDYARTAAEQSLKMNRELSARLDDLLDEF